MFGFFVDKKNLISREEKCNKELIGIKGAKIVSLIIS